MIYFDTTFLVKLHVLEPGSAIVAEMVRKKNEVIATFHHLEDGDGSCLASKIP